MDYQGQNLNPNLGPAQAPESVNAAPSQAAENPYLPPTRNMGELGGRLVSNGADSLMGGDTLSPETPSLDEVMNTDESKIEVEELERPPLMPEGMMTTPESGASLQSGASPVNKMMRRDTVSPEVVKEIKSIEDSEMGKNPAAAYDKIAKLSSDYIKELRGFGVGEDPLGSKAA